VGDDCVLEILEEVVSVSNLSIQILNLLLQIREVVIQIFDILLLEAHIRAELQE